MSSSPCIQFGQQSGSNGTCQCPVGFGGPTCSSIVCDSSLVAPANRSIIQSTAGPSGCVSTNQCASGFSGLDCNLCTTDAACAAAVSASRGSSSDSSFTLGDSVQCSTSPYAYTTSFAQCDVINPTLQAVFPGSTTLKFQRNINVNSTLTQGLAPVNSTYAQLWYSANSTAAPQEQFYCYADTCTQTNDTSRSQIRLSCNNLKCQCLSSAAMCNPPLDLSETFNGLSGVLQIDCNYNGTSCNFIQDTLQQLFGQNGLGLTGCRFGECVSSTVVQQYSGGPTVSSSNSDLPAGVIAGLAVVAGLILLALLTYVMGFVSQRRARRGGKQRLQQALPAGLAWSGISYALSRDRGAATIGVLRRKNKASTLSTYVEKIGEPSLSAESDSIVRAGSGQRGRLILDNLTGSLPPGGLLAILGPSGAGKSTFVDILAGKRKSGRTEGNVRVTSATTSSTIRARIGYVDQADVLSENLTVRESLMFAAKLKLPEDTPETEMSDRVWEILGQLGLRDVAHSRVGSGERRGISGGERRRLSIGLELIAKPSILILDEPTSGLDSVSASKVVKVLRDLAIDASGLGTRTTIVATIHQPSSQIFHAFDSVLVLSSRGTMVYSGPTDQATNYFATRGYPCPSDWNPADHLLELASTPSIYRQLSDGSSSPDETPAKGHGSSYDTTTGDNSLDGIAAAETKLSAARPTTTRLTQFQTLSYREFLNLKRDWSLIVMHNAVAIIVGLFVGGLYFQVDTTIAGFQNRIGSLFFIGALVAFSALSALSNLFTIRPLYLRERTSAYYGPIVWMLSRAIWDIIPLRILPTVLLGSIVYWMVGLSPDAARFFKFLLILIEYSAAITLWNLLLAVLIPKPAVAILVSNVINLAQLAYAGFFVNLSKITPALRWLQWLNPLKYTLEALSVNEVGAGLMINDVLSGVPVSINAQIIMELLFGFKMSAYYRDVIVMFGWMALFGLCLILAIWRLREIR